MNKLEILIQGRDEASQALKEIQGNLDGLDKTARNMGLGMLAAGGAMMAGFGMAMKAAAEEEAGIRRLSIAMKNMGLSYEAVEGSLESWIDTMQQKTAVADDEQRESLAMLIGMTGNLAEAQDYLTVAMDLAAGTGRDLASATTLIGYAMSGNWGMVGRLIPAIKEAKTEEERWMMLRTLFAGQAEEFGDTMEGQMKRLQHNIGDLKEILGGFVSDAAEPAVRVLNDLIQGLKDMDSGIMRFATNMGMVSALTLTVTGGFMVLHSQWSKVITGFQGLTNVILGTGASITRFIGLLGGLAVGISMITFGLTELQKNARIRQLELELSEAYQKALKGEHAEYVKLLEKRQQMGYALTEENRAYIEQYHALTKVAQATSDFAKVTDLIEKYQKEAAEATDDWTDSLEGVIGKAKELGFVFDEVTEAWYANTLAVLGNNAALQRQLDLQNQLSELSGYARAGMVSIETYWALRAEAEEQERHQKEIERMNREAQERYGMGYVPPQGWTAPGAEERVMQQYQFGGVVSRTGPAFLHKGETVTPAGSHITLPINLDGREIARYVIEITGNQARLQGVV